MNPVGEIGRGLRAYWWGVAWLKKHPGYLALLFVPWLLGFVFMTTTFLLFMRHDTRIMAWLLIDFGQAWYWQPFYYLAWFFVYLGAILFSLLSGYLLANIIASPIYDIVSIAVERDIRHGQIEEVSLWQSIKLIPEELKKVTVILSLSLLLLVIPGLNILAVFMAAFLLGWDFYDYPLARRGWPFRQRIAFVWGDFWAVLGLGLCLMVPFVQLLLLPLTIAGGTMLNLERLDKLANKRSSIDYI